MTDLERLIELLDNAPADPAGNRNVRTLAEYLLANGAIVPPCKVGDTVYMPWEFDENKGIAILEVVGIYFRYEYGFIKTDLFSDCDEFLSRYNYGRFGFSDFGKTVFLTREEAERALKGR